LPDGLFWLIQVPDQAVEIGDRTVTVRLDNVPVTDQFTFYDPLPPSGNVPSVTSFVMTYTRSGALRRVRPTSTDPTSPFNWAGEMWTASGSCTFAAAYADGSFAVRGSATSAGQFGELGRERNGLFVHQGSDPAASDETP
jgi:hypothetical protein